MKVNRALRIVLGLILIILFGIYSFMDLSQRPTSEDFDKALSAPAPTVAPTPTEAPAESTEAPIVDAGGEESGSEEAPAETGTEAAPTNALPDIDLSSWEFVLVNATNPLTKDFAPEIGTIEGLQLDARIIPAMQDFVAAARAEGLNVFLSSGYRSYNDQSYLYNRKIGQGYSPEQAATIVAPPGTSEHQSGLACDITDRYYELKDSSLENTATFIWMSEHCHEYGFIVRYPKDKSGLTTEEAKTSVTGIIYEPWHFRYVGVEAATYIMENGLCLEEFIALYNQA